MTARAVEASSSGEGAITVRRIEFALPERLDPVVFEGRPEESYTAPARFTLEIEQLDGMHPAARDLFQ